MSSGFDLPAVQAAIKEFQLDGWLLVRFPRHATCSPVACCSARPTRHATRRWLYFIPASGEPRSWCIASRPAALDHLPGRQDRLSALAGTGGGRGASWCRASKRVAMEYSPRNANPYVSRVDAGTVELVRVVRRRSDVVGRLGSTVRGDLGRRAVGRCTSEAAKHTDAAYRRGVAASSPTRGRAGGRVRETRSADGDHGSLRRHGLTTDHPPIVAVGPHSGDPHYAPTRGDDRPFARRFRADRPVGEAGSAASRVQRLTRVGVRRRRRARAVHEDFQHRRRRARRGHRARARRRSPTSEPLQGWQVDDAARDVIEKAGYGAELRPSHRPQHRPGDARQRRQHGRPRNARGTPRAAADLLLHRAGHLPAEFGVRSEVNVFVDADGGVHVTGEVQREIRRCSL